MRTFNLAAIGSALAALLFTLVACEPMVDPTPPPPEPPSKDIVAKINEMRAVHEDVGVTFNATDATAPLADRLRTVAERLTALPTVTRATASGDTIELTHTSGLDSVMLFLEEGSDRRGPGAAQPAAVRVARSDHEEPPTLAPEIADATYLPAANGTPLVVNAKVLICAPLDHNPHEPQYAETGEAVANIFRNAPAGMPDFDVTYLKYRECNLEALAKASDYGTIVFSGHGSGGKNLHLAIEVDNEHVNRYRSLYGEGSVLFSSINVITSLGEYQSGRSRSAITYKFFHKYLKPTVVQGRGRVIVTPACTTTKQVAGGDLEDALSRVGVHVGYDGLVDDPFADDTTKRFFNSMMKGESAMEAFNALPVKVDGGVNIQIYGTGSYRYAVSPPPPDDALRTQCVDAEIVVAPEIRNYIEGETWLYWKWSFVNSCKENVRIYWLTAEQDWSPGVRQRGGVWRLDRGGRKEFEGTRRDTKPPNPLVVWCALNRDAEGRIVEGTIDNPCVGENDYRNNSTNWRELNY